MFTPENPLVISSSGLTAYLRCPKSFEFGYVERYRMPGKECMVAGVEFHHLMEMFVKGATEDELRQAASLGFFPHMFDVFDAFRHAKDGSFPRRESIIGSEEPLYTLLLPNVWLRTTFDLIWDDDGELTDDDYKTFEKDMNLNLGLDFQGRLFLTVLGKKFNTDRVKRRYRKVRRTAPGVPKNATEQKKADAGKPFESWSPEQCYHDYTLRLVPGEADRVWAEAQHWARKLLMDLETRTKDPNAGAFGRVVLSGVSPFTCGSCMYKTICTKDVLCGAINEVDLITEGIIIGEPVELPPELSK